MHTFHQTIVAATSATGVLPIISLHVAGVEQVVCVEGSQVKAAFLRLGLKPFVNIHNRWLITAQSCIYSAITFTTLCVYLAVLLCLISSTYGLVIGIIFVPVVCLGRERSSSNRGTNSSSHASDGYHCAACIMDSMDMPWTGQVIWQQPSSATLQSGMPLIQHSQLTILLINIISSILNLIFLY